MADNKQQLPNDEVLEESAVQQVENTVESTVDEVASAVEDLVQDISIELDAPASDSQDASKPSFWQKTKKAFIIFGKKVVWLWNKVVGFFSKNKKQQPQEEEPAEQQQAVVIPAELLEGPKLSKKEKFARFCKSQSGWLFVLPAVILLAIFTIYPIGKAFIGAFMENYNPMNLVGERPYTGWGFENFTRVLKGDTGTGGATFVQCLVNTTVFTLISVPLSTILALLISVALTSIKPLQKLYQTVLFLPYLTNALAMGAVFATFFNVVGTVKNPETPGLINIVLGWFNIAPIDWIKGGSEVTWVLSDNLVIPWSRYIVIIVYEIWSGLPFKILILFSALQSVNKQYYDAAKIDGASKFKVLTKITTPMISPMISYLIVTGIMGGMKQYTAVVGIFGADKLNAYNINTAVGYIYQYVSNSEMGYAFAGSLLLFLIIMVITAINRYVSSKRVNF